MKRPIAIAAAAVFAAAVVTGAAVQINMRSTGHPVADLPVTLNSGAINPAVTDATVASTICVKGWTATVRPPTSYTNGIKQGLLAKLGPGFSHNSSDYELDHVVPLEAGGAPSDPANLALQSWTGLYNAHEKDKVENRVHAEICGGQISLAAGRGCFLVDWRACP